MISFPSKPSTKTNWTIKWKNWPLSVKNVGATDIVEADDRVWKVRRNCLESTRVFSKVATSEDLVVPVTKIADCIQTLVKESKNYDFRVFCLAHAGDGNLHFQILKCDMSDEDWEKQLKEFRAKAYKIRLRLGRPPVR